MEVDSSFAPGPSTGLSQEVSRQRKGLSTQVPRLRKGEMRVEIERRNQGTGYKFKYKKHDEKVKTERNQWFKDPGNENILVLEDGHHGYTVWGYKPARR
ncbi:hypothetical protein LY76DRAFT_599331 [Colletotrichum caudatum]|nr:hypothetical protein LY76DRAFT_599331 [Colletotrichum caudatum]